MKFSWVVCLESQHLWSVSVRFTITELVYELLVCLRMCVRHTIGVKQLASQLDIWTLSKRTRKTETKANSQRVKLGREPKRFSKLGPKELPAQLSSKNVLILDNRLLRESLFRTRSQSFLFESNNDQRNCNVRKWKRVRHSFIGTDQNRSPFPVWCSTLYSRNRRDPWSLPEFIRPDTDTLHLLSNWMSCVCVHVCVHW